MKLSKEIYLANQHCTMLVRLYLATLGFMCSSVSPVVGHHQHLESVPWAVMKPRTSMCIWVQEEVRFHMKMQEQFEKLEYFWRVQLHGRACSGGELLSCPQGQVVGKDQNFVNFIGSGWVKVATTTHNSH